MKILHVYKTFYPETFGGVEQVIKAISTGIRAKGGESRVLATTSGRSRVFVCEGVEHHLCSSQVEVASNTFSFELFIKFKELSNWADVIHFHYPWPTGDLLSLVSNKKMLVTYHSDIVKQKILKFFYQPLEYIFLNKVDLIVSTSPNYAKTSKNLLKFSDKVEIIPLGIDHECYLSKNNEWELDDEFNFLGQGYFLFLGVLRYYKGLMFLIEAAKETGARVVIAGDGPMYEKIKNKIEVEEIKNVILTGFVDEKTKLKLLKNCKAFVFPSHLRSEAFGVSLLEAQVFSKAIICCDISTGANYVNVHGVTGISVEPGNSAQLSDAINLLERDVGLCKSYGNNGYNRLMSLFTLDRMVGSYDRLYEKMINNG
ncbi:glycosyltransferase [Marinomonas dokdonensis]|uniref:glycosyltransferase n=1 Tax=Marinomonas dokdonensis TaxID=328224 RepID=UPI0040554DBC